MVGSCWHIEVVVFLAIKNAFDLFWVFGAVPENSSRLLLFFFDFPLGPSDLLTFFVDPLFEFKPTTVVGSRRNLLLTIEIINFGLVHSMSVLDGLLSNFHHLWECLCAHFVNRWDTDFIKEVSKGMPCKYRSTCARWRVILFLLLYNTKLSISVVHLGSFLWTKLVQV